MVVAKDNTVEVVSSVVAGSSTSISSFDITAATTNEPRNCEKATSSSDTGGAENSTLDGDARAHGYEASGCHIDTMESSMDLQAVCSEGDPCEDEVAKRNVESKTASTTHLSWAQRAARLAGPKLMPHPSLHLQTGAKIVDGTASDSSCVAVQDASSLDSARHRTASILDCIAVLAKQKVMGPECGTTDRVTSDDHPIDTPEAQQLRRCLDENVAILAEPSYTRLGLRNEANTCYVNVVVQSLLSCAALVWLLRHCAPNDELRPVYTCLWNMCNEFHTRKLGGPPLSMLPMMGRILSRWQQLGAQQDAGEFLFYILSSLHEECKWKIPIIQSTMPTDKPSTSEEKVAGWLHVVKTSTRLSEERTAGMQEDSPVARVFGGVMRSIVRTRGAQADSVSLEPFNHLTLDISHQNVTSVMSALSAHCMAESVNDGRATRTLQFKTLPNVLIICLKRFLYDRGKCSSMKIQKPIKYGPKLVFDRSWLADGVDPDAYSITAVICHHGDTVHRGHYTAVVRYKTEWYLYDDTNVRRIDVEEVASQQSEVYLLVYQRKAVVNFRP